MMNESFGSIVMDQALIINGRFLKKNVDGFTPAPSPFVIPYDRGRSYSYDNGTRHPMHSEFQEALGMSDSNMYIKDSVFDALIHSSSSTSSIGLGINTTLDLGAIVATSTSILTSLTLYNSSEKTTRWKLSSNLGDAIAFQLSNENYQNDQMVPQSSIYQLLNEVDYVSEVEIPPLANQQLIIVFHPHVIVNQIAPQSNGIEDTPAHNPYPSDVYHFIPVNGMITLNQQFSTTDSEEKQDDLPHDNDPAVDFSRSPSISSYSPSPGPSASSSSSPSPSPSSDSSLSASRHSAAASSYSESSSPFSSSINRQTFDAEHHAEHPSYSHYFSFDKDSADAQRHPEVCIVSSEEHSTHTSLEPTPTFLKRRQSSGVNLTSSSSHTIDRPTSSVRKVSTDYLSPSKFPRTFAVGSAPLQSNFIPIQFSASVCRSVLTVDVLEHELLFDHCLMNESYSKTITIFNHSQIATAFVLNLAQQHIFHAEIDQNNPSLDSEGNATTCFDITEFDSGLPLAVDSTTSACDAFCNDHLSAFTHKTSLSEGDEREMKSPVEHQHRYAVYCHVPSFSHTRLRIAFRPSAPYMTIGERLFELTLTNVRDPTNVIPLTLHTIVRAHKHDDDIMLFACSETIVNDFLRIANASLPALAESFNVSPSAISFAGIKSDASASPSNKGDDARRLLTEVDFGSCGSDNVSIRLFCLKNTSEYTFEIHLSSSAARGDVTFHVLNDLLFADMSMMKPDDNSDSGLPKSVSQAISESLNINANQEDTISQLMTQNFSLEKSVITRSPSISVSHGGINVHFPSPKPNGTSSANINQPTNSVSISDLRGYRVEVITLRPGKRKNIMVTYKPESEIDAMTQAEAQADAEAEYTNEESDETRTSSTIIPPNSQSTSKIASKQLYRNPAYLLQPRKFRLYLTCHALESDMSLLSVKSNFQSPSQTKDHFVKRIRAFANVCTSMVTVAPSRLHFQDVNLGSKTTAFVKLSNLSDLPAELDIALNSQSVHLRQSSLVLKPRSSHDLRLDFIARRVNPNYHKELLITNKNNPSNCLLIKLTASIIDAEQDLYYRITKPIYSRLIPALEAESVDDSIENDLSVLSPSEPIHLLNFGAVVVNNPQVRLLSLTNLTSNELCLTFNSSQPSEIRIYTELREDEMIEMERTELIDSNGISSDIQSNTTTKYRHDSNTTVSTSKSMLTISRTTPTRVSLLKKGSALSELWHRFIMDCQTAESMSLVDENIVDLPSRTLNTESQTTDTNGEQVYVENEIRRRRDLQRILQSDLLTLISANPPTSADTSTTSVGILSTEVRLAPLQKLNLFVFYTIGKSIQRTWLHQNLRTLDANIQIQSYLTPTFSADSSSSSSLPINTRELVLQCKVCQSSLDVDQQHINFGTLTHMDKQEKSLVISNRSQVPLLYAIRKSGSMSSLDLEFSAASMMGVIRPYGQRELPFLFKPSLAGQFVEAITIVNIQDPADVKVVQIKAVLRKPEQFWLKSMLIDFGLCAVRNETSKCSRYLHHALQRIVLKNISSKSRTFKAKLKNISLLHSTTTASILSALQQLQEDPVDGYSNGYNSLPNTDSEIGFPIGNGHGVKPNGLATIASSSDIPSKETHLSVHPEPSLNNVSSVSPGFSLTLPPIFGSPELSRSVSTPVPINLAKRNDNLMAASPDQSVNGLPQVTPSTSLMRSLATSHSRPPSPISATSVRQNSSSSSINGNYNPPIAPPFARLPVIPKVSLVLEESIEPETGSSASSVFSPELTAQEREEEEEIVARKLRIAIRGKKLDRIEKLTKRLEELQKLRETEDTDKISHSDDTDEHDNAPKGLISPGANEEDGVEIEIEPDRVVTIRVGFQPNRSPSCTDNEIPFGIVECFAGVIEVYSSTNKESKKEVRFQCIVCSDVATADIAADAIKRGLKLDEI